MGYSNLSDQPCFHCKNFCFGCEWSESKGKVPVPGWKAIKVRKCYSKNHIMETYRILDCPKFTDDGTGTKKDKLSIKITGGDKVEAPIDGKKLKILIFKNSNSILSFSKKAGLSNAVISRYIYERIKPTKISMSLIAQGLDMTLEELIEKTRKD